MTLVYTPRMLVCVRRLPTFIGGNHHLVYAGFIMVKPKLSTFKFSDEDRRQLDHLVEHANRTYRVESFLPRINRTQMLRNLIAIRYAEVTAEEEKVERSIQRAKTKRKRKLVEKAS